MALDPRAFENALQAWLEPLRGTPPTPTELRGVSIDGKSLRGTRTLDPLLTMLVAAFDHQTGTVLRQLAVPSGTNEQKAALDLFKQLVLTGRVITADALHCQQETCQLITDSGGHYVLTVKTTNRRCMPRLPANSWRRTRRFPPASDDNGELNCKPPRSPTKGTVVANNGSSRPRWN